MCFIYEATNSNSFVKEHVNITFIQRFKTSGRLTDPPETRRVDEVQEDKRQTRTAFNKENKRHEVLRGKEAENRFKAGK